MPSPEHDMSSDDPPQTMVCLVRHHGRSEDLATVLGWKVTYVFPTYRGPLPVAIVLRYVRSLITTFGLLSRAGDSVAIMVPPPLIVFLRPLLKNRGIRMVLDVHSGLMTDLGWRPVLKLFYRCLRTTDVVLAHTDGDRLHLRSQVKAEVCTLQDPVLTARALRGQVLRFGPPKRAAPTVVFPSSGDVDEPLKTFEDAVRLVRASNSDLRVVATGKAAAFRLDSAVVETSGYLPSAKFDALMSEATVIVALTTRPNILQRAAFEALVEGVRPVVSDSRPLRALFGDFAEYVDPISPQDIARGVIDALRRGVPERSEIELVRSRIAEMERIQLATVKEALTSAGRRQRS